MIRLAVVLSFVLLATACRTSSAPDYEPTTARFFLEELEGHGALMKLPQSEVKLTVGAKPVLTEFDIVAVDVVEVAMGKCLKFEFTPAAARDLYRLTAGNQGRRLVLSINQTPLGARRIDRPVDDGTLLIFIETPDSALSNLAENLRQTSRTLQQAAAKR